MVAAVEVVVLVVDLRTRMGVMMSDLARPMFAVTYQASRPKKWGLGLLC